MRCAAFRLDEPVSMLVRDSRYREAYIKHLIYFTISKWGMLYLHIPLYQFNYLRYAAPFSDYAHPASWRKELLLMM